MSKHERNTRKICETCRQEIIIGGGHGHLVTYIPPSIWCPPGRDEANYHNKCLTPQQISESEKEWYEWQKCNPNDPAHNPEYIRWYEEKYGKPTLNHNLDTDEINVLMR